MSLAQPWLLVIVGSALGGGASQSVFGGGGGADFLAKLTQGLAATFMLCAVFLAYASAHTGSDRLEDASKELNADIVEEDDDAPVDYERIGPNPLKLPPAGSAPTRADVPADAPVEGGGEAVEAEAPAPEEPAAPAPEPTPVPEPAAEPAP